MKRWIHAAEGISDWREDFISEINSEVLVKDKGTCTATITEYDDYEGDIGFTAIVMDNKTRKSYTSEFSGPRGLENAKKWCNKVIGLIGKGVIQSSTQVIEATEIIPNKKIQEGLWWDSDGHNMEVTWVSKDGKKCKITETWISEDDGKHKKHVMNCLIGSDENGEYAYEPTDYNIEHLNDDSYWWIKKYAAGAWNYPYDLTNIDDESEDTLGRILNKYIQEANDGDYYNSVTVMTESDEILYKGHALEEAQRVLEDYLDCEAESAWHDDTITIVVDAIVDSEDEYTPSSSAGDYGPGNPWDAPGMSVKDFI